MRVCNANVKAKATVRNAAEVVSASRPRSDRLGGWQGHKRLAGLAPPPPETEFRICSARRKDGGNLYVISVLSAPLIHPQPDSFPAEVEARGRTVAASPPP